MTPGPWAQAAANAWELPAVLVGYWFDPAKFAAACVWFLFVAWAVGAVARDARRRRLTPDAWPTMLAAAGFFGLLPLIFVKYFPIGLFFAFVVFLPFAYMYVHAVRNPQVPAGERFLTDEHLVEIGKDLLEGVGFSFDSEDGRGPQVRLLPSREVRREPAGMQISTLETVLTDAHRQRASEVQIESSRDRMTIRRRIDGVWIPVDAAEVGPGLSDLLTRLAGGKTGDARRSLQSSVGARVGGKRTTLEVSATTLGPKRRFGVRLPRTDAPAKVEDLSLSDRDRQTLLDALRNPNGLILFVSPPNSGRWTTMQACIGNMDLLARRVAVIEEANRPYRGPEPVEHEPIDVNHAAGYSFALRGALAKKPDVLLCGRIAGAESVQLCLEAAAERLVIAGVDSRGVVDGITHLLSFGAAREPLADRLRCALGQRLPRKLCPECREAYLPSPDAVRRANLGEMIADRLYRARPIADSSCPVCGGVGYRGCQPLYEMLPLSPRLRALLRGGATERELLLEARKDGMESPAESALKLLASGVTSADELRRVLQSSAAVAAEVVA